MIILTIILGVCAFAYLYSIFKEWQRLVIIQQVYWDAILEDHKTIDDQYLKVMKDRGETPKKDRTINYMIQTIKTKNHDKF